MKIFIGGSRAVSKLDGTIRDRLEDFIRRGDSILIGDANGADKAVQQHFADRHYRDVEVFCTGDQARNNVGAWPVRHVTAPGRRKDFSYYAAKDAAMAKEAGCGVMFWDGKSKGTLQNVLNLIALGKKALIYFAPAKEFQVVSTDQDVQSLLARCDRGSIEAARRALGVPLTQPSLPLGHS